MRGTPAAISGRMNRTRLGDCAPTAIAAHRYGAGADKGNRVDRDVIAVRVARVTLKRRAAARAALSKRWHYPHQARVKVVARMLPRCRMPATTRNGASPRSA